MEKTLKDHLVDTLDELVKEQLTRFKDKLGETRFQGRKIAKGKLQKATSLDVADLLISTYSKKHAAEITVSILRAINEAELAEYLKKKTRAGDRKEIESENPVGLCSRYINNPEQRRVVITHAQAPGDSLTETSPPGKIDSVGSDSVFLSWGSPAELHFVDQHRFALVQRVVSVETVADALLEKRMLQETQYDEILAEKVSSAQMRLLYKFARAWGNGEKDVFLEILKKLQPHLIKDLQGD